MHLFELVRTLVDIESITGNEGACVQFLSRHLAALKFRVELQRVDAQRSNVLALWGKPRVVLSTHLDTVPPFLPAREDDEFIYGRGACDAKGIVGAQVAAAERLAAEGVKDFGLLFLVGEETVSDGACAANRSPRGSRFIINGEPTENKLAVGSKGILLAEVRARGRAAHSAYPQLGDSAIEKLLDALDALRRLPLPRDRVLGPATMNIGLISGGCAANVVPDQASAKVMFRTVGDSKKLRASVRRCLKGRAECNFVRDTPALRLQAVEGFETDVVAFTTDLPNLKRWGRPLLLGPGSISVAHTDHERVRKSELERAVELYCKLVKKLKSVRRR